MPNRFIRSIYRDIRMRWIRFRFGLKSVSSTFYIAGKSWVSPDLIAGDYSYVGPNCSLPPKVEIGKYTMIAPNVSILGGDHNFDNPSNPIIFSGRPKMPKTIIGKDVWIGSNTLIMAGVRIGNGSIVAAGSIITRDVLPYSIVGGNPAKLIKMRFNDKEIEKHKIMLSKKNIKPHLTSKKK